MSELCLTIEEQIWLVELISTNTETAATFLEGINENNVTEYPKEYIALMTKCYQASKKLGGLIEKVKQNVERYENE